MYYTTKVELDAGNAERELVLHTNHPRLEHCKALGRLIGYLKVKYTK